MLCALLVLNALASSDSGIVVWAVLNESLGTSVVKWILRRLIGDELDETSGVEAHVIESKLSKLRLLCEPFEHGLRRITVQDGKLQLIPVDAVSVDKVKLFVVDEAHHVQKTGKLESLVEQYRQGAPLVLLSDVSQSDLGDDFDDHFGGNVTTVELKEVVRCSRRIVLGAGWFSLANHAPVAR